MKTTVQLDDDLLTELREISKERRASLQETIAAAIRAGLAGLRPTRPVAAPQQYELRTMSLGACRLPNLDNISEVLAYCEGEDYR